MSGELLTSDTDMTRRMHRYEVKFRPVINKINLSGDPVAFGNLDRNEGIEFWAEDDDSKPSKPRTFTVLGTSHKIPDGAMYVGTAPRDNRGFTWHLFELAE